jgi:hypothetical protein
MNEPSRFLPSARREGIIRKELDGELLIYDLTRDKAHCLNESAAAIWKRCDGRTSTKEIAASLAKEVGASVDERVVWLALADLRRSHLLEEPAILPKQIAALRGMSRREAVRRIGLGAAIALPIVATIVAPTAAQAGSCLHAGAGCNAGPDCCSGTCTGVGGTCVGG